MSLESLTRAIRASFRLFRLQADAGKVRFGNYTRTFANAVKPHYVSFFGKLALDPLTKDAVDAAIEGQALFMADSVLDTSSNWLQEGRDPRDVFSTDRAANIAITESTWAIGSAKTVRTKARGKWLRWVTGGKPCKDCKSLNGQVRKPGEYFRSLSGKEVLHPGLHQTCKCKLVEVPAKEKISPEQAAREFDRFLSAPLRRG